MLSYVRLFALGLSGGILAGVFNSLAVEMSPDHVVFGPVVMVLISGKFANFSCFVRSNFTPSKSKFTPVKPPGKTPPLAF